MSQQNDAPESSAVGKPTRARPKRKRRFWITAALAPIWLPLLFYGCIRIAHPNAGPENIRISKETTFVTEPLDDEGDVDFVAATNLRWGDAVTRQNNAAVLLASVLELSDEMSSSMKEEYYRELGVDGQRAEITFISIERFVEEQSDLIAEPADFGVPATDAEEQEIDETEQDAEETSEELDLAKFESDFNSALAARDWSSVHELSAQIPFDWHEDKSDVFDRQLSVARLCPWQPEDYPAVAAWLELNEDALEVIVEASQRPRFYSPLVTEATSARLLMAEYPLLQEMRDPAAALSARAMLCLANNDAKAAWDDVLAVHRLARLAGQHPTLVGGMVALWMEKFARLGDIALAGHLDLSPELVARIRREFEALPPTTDMIEKMDVGERMQLLDSIISLAKGDFGEQEGSRITQHWNDSIVNWNNILHDANDFMDQYVHAFRTRDDDGFDAWNEIDAITAEAESPVTIATAIVIGSQREKMLKGVVSNFLMPSFNIVARGHARESEEARLIRIALAVAHYRVDHQELPTSLERLVPAYLKSIPTDYWHEKPYLYQAADSTFLVYGVGYNGVNDGGAPLWVDGREDYDHSDYVIAVPPRVDVEFYFGIY